MMSKIQGKHDDLNAKKKERFKLCSPLKSNGPNSTLISDNW